MIDIYSRMIVGAHVHHTEIAELAVDLMTELLGAELSPSTEDPNRGRGGVRKDPGCGKQLIEIQTGQP